MVSKWSVAILIAVMYAASFKVIEACKPPPLGKEDVPQQPDVEEPLKECLTKMNVKNISAVSDIFNGDVQCVMKYLWIQPQGSARGYSNDNITSNRFGVWPGVYRRAFNYSEPSLKTVTIDPTCNSLSGKKETTPSGKHFVAVAWYCLEFCEQACGRVHGKVNYPVKKVTCDAGNSIKTGCETERICKCTGPDGNPCGDKTITFHDIIVEYNNTCLNCMNNRKYNAEDLLKTCMEALKDWQHYKPSKDLVFPHFVIKYENKVNYYKTKPAAKAPPKTG